MDTVNKKLNSFETKLGRIERYVKTKHHIAESEEDEEED